MSQTIDLDARRLSRLLSRWVKISLAIRDVEMMRDQTTRQLEETRCRLAEALAFLALGKGSVNAADRAQMQLEEFEETAEHCRLAISVLNEWQGANDRETQTIRERKGDNTVDDFQKMLMPLWCFACEPGWLRY